jgi:hypothetical protein
MRKTLPFERPTLGALLASLGASAAALTFAWLLLSLPGDLPPKPFATVRVRAVGDDRGEIAIEQTVADLLRSENLASAVNEAWYAGQANDRVISAAAIEGIRELLRIDLGLVNEAGVQTITIWWTGDPRRHAAARLVNVLARRLATKLPDVQLGPYQAEYIAAQGDVEAAQKAVDEAGRRLEAALTALDDVFALSSTGPSAAGRPDADAAAPTTTLDDSRLLRQRLVDLEARRQTLAERLMPQHPEMKALDDKIEQLRSALAVRDVSSFERLPNVVETVTVPARESAFAQAAKAELQASQQAVRLAQANYKTAQLRQRKSLESVVEASRQLMPEIVPAAPIASIRYAMSAWKRWLLSATTALLCGGLVIAVWPRPQALASAEEVRAVTRLPVFVIESTTLN